MKNQDFAAWCKRATKKIRYKPDRKAVSDELMAHLEDQYEALLAQGLSSDEAAAKALAAMGSAEEIAPQLGAIHRPLLGYLYSAVRYLAVFTGIWAAVMLCSHAFNQLQTKYFYDSFETYTADAEVFYTPNTNITVEGYHIRIPDAAADLDNGILYFQVEVTNWPWMEGFNAMDEFWAVDSEGNWYPAYNYDNAQSHYGLRFRSGTGSTGINICVMALNGFDCDAQWVELRYDRDGRDIALRIDLSGGDGT